MAFHHYKQNIGDSLPDCKIPSVETPHDKKQDQSLGIGEEYAQVPSRIDLSTDSVA